MTSRYVGILYDPKNAGEATHRPQLRVPPLRMDLHKAAMDVAFKRRGGDGVDLDDGDLYFVLDGGKTGNANDLLRTFQGKSKVVKTFVITRDEDSVVSRLGRIAGVGNANLTETLHLVSAQQVRASPRSTSASLVPLQAR